MLFDVHSFRSGFGFGFTQGGSVRRRFVGMPGNPAADGLHQTGEVVCQDRRMKVIDASSILRKANIGTAASAISYLNIDYNHIRDKGLSGISR